MSTDKIGGYAYGKNVKTKMLGNKGLEIINQSIKIFDKKIVCILICSFCSDFVHQSSQVSFISNCISAYFFV
jgi:hypothetical protein